MKATIRYLNTDLELVAATDLTPLAEELVGKGLFQLNLLLHDEQWHASFETVESFDEPEENVLAFLSVIESLSSTSRSLWSACSVRTFNIGYECGDEPFSQECQVAVPVLARIVAVDASLRITLYAGDRGSQAMPDADSNAG